MTTTGELRAIIQELHLVDVGDAESYLGEEGEETMEGEESIVLVEEVTPIELVTDSAVLADCECRACDLVHV